MNTYYIRFTDQSFAYVMANDLPDVDKKARWLYRKAVASIRVVDNAVIPALALAA